MTAAFDWILSPVGRTACAASALTVAGLMIVMSFLQWRMNRRHAANRLMIAAMLLSPAFWIRPTGPDLDAALACACLLSFILINWAVLALYATLRRSDQWMLGALIGLAAGVSVLQHGLDAGWFGAGWTSVFRPVDLLLLVVSGLMPAHVLPRIGQRARMAAAQACFLLSRLVAIAEAGTEAALPVWIPAIGLLLATAHFHLLFFILFRRSLERMRSVYISAIKDGLTGLYNRRHFLKKTNRYAAHGLPVSILFCDIDNFKRLNDTMGHHAADEALKRVAAILSEEVSGYGTAGRFGGEELVASIARPGADPAAIAEAFRQRVERETNVTVSIGVCPAIDGVSVEEALRRADEAMYASKSSGKNRVTVHRPAAEADRMARQP
jgi:diguanylate cyclase (GGDEF)-like protein